MRATESVCSLYLDTLITLKIALGNCVKCVTILKRVDEEKREKNPVHVCCKSGCLKVKLFRCVARVVSNGGHLSLVYVR